MWWKVMSVWLSWTWKNMCALLKPVCLIYMWNGLLKINQECGFLAIQILKTPESQFRTCTSVAFSGLSLIMMLKSSQRGKMNCVKMGKWCKMWESLVNHLCWTPFYEASNKPVPFIYYPQL